MEPGFLKHQGFCRDRHGTELDRPLMPDATAAFHIHMPGSFSRYIVSEVSRVPVGVRFGAYELDVAGMELRKNGVRMRLQEQPFLVLICSRGQARRRRHTRGTQGPGVGERYLRRFRSIAQQGRKSSEGSAERRRFSAQIY